MAESVFGYLLTGLAFDDNLPGSYNKENYLYIQYFEDSIELFNLSVSCATFNNKTAHSMRP